MVACDLYEHWRQHLEPGVFFCLVGGFSQGLLVEICETVSQQLHMNGSDPETRMKVHAVIVESLQNIIRYSARKTGRPHGSDANTERGFGALSIGAGNGRYTVSSGNPIENGKIPDLRQWLTRLQAMDPRELRALFLERRKDDTRSRSRGAGLGFIEMARKASGPLQFDFRPVDDKVSFFRITIVI